MNTIYPAEDLHLLNQVVSEPRFQRLIDLPVVAPAELLVLVGSYAAFGLATWAGIAGVIPYLAALLINATALYAVFTPLHDAVHRTVSRNPVLNDLIGNLAAMLLVPGITTRLYRHLHLEHHRYTGEKDKDPDEPFISAPLPLRVLVWMFLDVHWSWFYIRHRNERPANERRAFWISIGLSVTWHAAWLLSPWAKEFLLYWMIPQRLGLTVLVYLFAFIQHPDGIEQRQAPLQATRMIRGGALARLLLLGQSEHLVHHLFPGVPFYRYHDVWVLGQPAFRGRETVWQSPLGYPTRPRSLPSAAVAATIPVRVTVVEDIAEGVRAYELSATQGHLPPFAAGAHLDVHVAPGIVRQYSLCSDPAGQGAWRIAVKREEPGRGGSRTLHERVQAGDTLEVGFPRNHFSLRPGAAHTVLIAGGIGITPLLAMAYELSTAGRTFEMHVCARSERFVPFSKRLRGAAFAGSVRFHLDDGPVDQRPGADIIPRWKKGSDLYLCGPAGFMSAMVDYAHAAGWPRENVFLETFVVPSADSSTNRPFEVVLKRSGRSLTVPADRSLLDVLQSSDIAITAVCTQGLCGACVATVLDGEVDHRDLVLGKRRDRNGCRMTTCVSRARSGRLVLDL